jgi:Spy/CpxP family protein refolding chaperone
MLTLNRSTPRTLALVLVAGLACQAFAQTSGQPTIIRRSTPARGGIAAPPPMLSPAAPLSKERLLRFAKVLELDADQTTAAQALYEAYGAQVERAQKDLSDKMKDQSDQPIFISANGDKPEMNELTKALSEHTTKSTQLRDQFLSDLKSILRPEQAGNWAALERLRRRDNFLSRGSLSGSTLDLTLLVDSLQLSPAEREPLADPMKQYELNLDRALQLREQFLDPGQGGVQTFNAESFKARQSKQREIDVKIKDVNLTAARQLAELVPPAQRAAFDDLVKRHTYRSVYKEPSAARKLAAASDLKSLSPAQREKLARAMEQYRRDAAAANQRWADAIAKAETAGLPTGASMMGGGKLDPELADARKARRELDSQLNATVKSTLTPEQVAELPEMLPAGGVQGRAVSVTAVADGSSGQHMVFTSEDDLDEDSGEMLGGSGVVIIRDERVVGPDGQPIAPPPPPPPNTPDQPKP